MEATIHRITRLTLKKVTYYTVSIDGKESEFTDFQKRMKDVQDYQIQLGQLFQFIKSIGDKFGAHEKHFRHERAAEALPPQYHYIEPSQNQYGLRLYCIRLSNSIVILLNGDMKTHALPDKCKNCSKHFSLANSLSRKINKAITDGLIKLNGSVIEIDDDFILEV